MMELSCRSNKFFTIPTFIFLLSLVLFSSSSSARSTSNNSNLFRAYIGAEFLDVKFSDLPINPRVEFHFILAFAIDYTNLSSPSPTNGNFNIFWDTDNLTPAKVYDIKKKHPNVKVAVSLGGDSVGNSSAYFAPSSVDSWVANAVSSLTRIVKEYHLDGIDIDYEHFMNNKHSKGAFVECIGRLISTLKKNRVISIASIAPYDDNGQVVSHYTALWRQHAGLIDHVNFQFYAYDKGTNVSQFMEYFDEQTRIYDGGRILASYISDGSLGLAPSNGFFRACKRLEKKGQLYGIFVWCADESKRLRFKYEKKSQRILAKVSHGY